MLLAGLMLRGWLWAGARLFGEQEVLVELNGERIPGPGGAGGTRGLGLRLPERLLKQENLLVFGLPGAVSPSSLGISDDRRELGIGLEWLVLEEAP